MSLSIRAMSFAGSTLRALGEAHAAAFGSGLDLRDAEALCEKLEPGDREQRLERRRQEAEAVDELHLQLVELRA